DFYSTASCRKDGYLFVKAIDFGKRVVTFLFDCEEKKDEDFFVKAIDFGKRVVMFFFDYEEKKDENLFVKAIDFGKRVVTNPEFTVLMTENLSNISIEELEAWLKSVSQYLFVHIKKQIITT
ncbi:18418_t:CDS:2, partial [Racocetra persica]